MCPREGELVEIDENGYAFEYYERLRKQTGAGWSHPFAEAMGAASFTDSNAVVGSLSTSQCVNIIMGWEKYRKSNFVEWPKGVPLPLWNEVHLVYPRNPSLSHNVKLLNQVAADDEFICVECSTLFSRVPEIFSSLNNIDVDPVFTSIFESLRVRNPEGVPPPEK